MYVLKSLAKIVKIIGMKEDKLLRVESGTTDPELS
jgi:hypothetical protein